MYDWSLRSSSGAREQPSAAVLDDACVVAGDEARPRRHDARSASSSPKRKPPLQVMHGFGVSPRRYPATNGVDDGPAEFVPQVERDVRHAERMARLPRREHGVGRAAGAFGVRSVGIEPEAECHPDRRSGSDLRSATALSTPPLIATATRPGEDGARNAGPIAFASASTARVSPPTAAASSSVSPTSGPLETVGVRDRRCAHPRRRGERKPSRPTRGIPQRARSRRSASPNRRECRLCGARPQTPSSADKSSCERSERICGSAPPCRGLRPQ